MGMIFPAAIDSFMPAVEYLTYKSYEYNRLNNPEIDASRWAVIYPDADILEIIFKEQKFLRNK